MFLIIGLTGFSGAGKTSLVKYLRRYLDINYISLGGIARKVSQDRKLSLEEQTEIFKNKSVGESCKEEIRLMKREHKILVVDGIRSRADYEFFKSQADKFVLFMIVADKEKRYKRICARNLKKDQSFLKNPQEHELWEWEFGIKEIFMEVDKFILNNGDISGAERDLFELICEYDIDKIERDF